MTKNKTRNKTKNNTRKVKPEIMPLQPLKGVIDRFPSKSKKIAARNELIKALNPLGFIKDTVAEILEYKHQVKVLETEQKRITEEARIRHHQIDASLKSAIMVLDERRKVIREFLQTASRNLQQHRVERRQIIQTITALNTKLIGKKVSLEEKQVILESIKMMSSILVNIGEKNTADLSIIADSTQKALDSVPLAGNLLTRSDER